MYFYVRIMWYDYMEILYIICVTELHAVNVLG